MTPLGTPRRIPAPNAGPFTLDGTVSWVVGRHDLAVIDPGPDVESHVRALVAACADAHRVKVLLTHAHGDHSAAVTALLAALLDGASPPEVTVHGNDHAGAIALADGDRIPTDRGELVCIATPGHARGHVAFHHPATGGIFAGDLILGTGDTTWVGEYPGCVHDYLASLERLKALELTVIHPGHGPDLDDPADAIARFERHRRDRIGQVRTLMDRLGSDDVDTLFDDLYGGRVPAGLARAARASLAALVEYVRDGAH